MSLNLDKRQRAMLQEMGVQVWLPQAPVAELPPAMPTVAAQADGTQAAGHFDDAGAAGHVSGRQHDEAPARPPDLAATERQTPSQPIPRQLARPSAGTSVSQPASASAVSSSSSSSSSSQSTRPATQGGAPAAWLLGPAQTLYADTAQAGGARWLVLAETPPTALHGGTPFSPFAGDAGQLLDNMLRAARLNRAGAVQFAPLLRQGAAAVTPEFVAALAALIESARPDAVLVMGRLASQALLPSGELFAKLRGRAHALHGARAVVTYDAPYLLRTSADKAKAWADLCLAMRVALAGGSDL